MVRKPTFALTRLAAAAILAVAITQLCSLESLAQTKTDDGSKPSFSWKQTETSLTLLNGDKVVWQHVHDKELGKPYMRVGLLDGTELTRPWPYPKDYLKRDHPWHRALWWSWKGIDGVNYWEENQQGTEPAEVKIAKNDDGSAVIKMTINYHLPDQPPVAIEKRRIAVGAPDATGSYLIDWQAAFTAAGKKDVVFKGNAYGGLAIRMAGEFCGDEKKGIPGWVFVTSQEPEGAKKGKARWMAYQGTAQNDRPATIAMFDHPDNPRYPSRWCTRTYYPYMNPAFTVGGDYTLPAGESLKLHYGVLIHDGAVDGDKLEREWKSFAGADDAK